MADINHVMVDLETLGTVPGCVGFSIGAVEFHPDRGTLGQEFYSLVCVEDSKDQLLRVEQGTVDWWETQRRKSPEAAAALDEAYSGTAPKLAEAMSDLNRFLLGLGGMRSIRLYGNGADFDNPILRVMWDAAGVPMLGSTAGFFGGRCYRTLKSLDELFGTDYKAPKLERQGTYHNALDDAKSQAMHLMAIVAAVKGLR